MMKNNVPLFRGSKVLFMRLPGASPEIQRITCLISVTRLCNPAVRTRRYFDDPFQHSDTVGRSVSYKFEMIFHRGDPLHEYLADIMDNRLGSDAIVTLYEADFSKSAGDGACACTEALFSVIPGKRFYDENGMLRYSGELAIRSIPANGSAVISENGSSLEFSRIG